MILENSVVLISDLGVFSNISEINVFIIFNSSVKKYKYAWYLSLSNIIFLFLFFKILYN